MAVATAEEAVRTLLAANTNVTTIVSTRIRPAMAAQVDPKPYLTYQRIATERSHHYGGPDDLVGPLIQINGWTTSASTLATLRKHVRLTLNGQGYQTVTIGANTLEVSAIFLQDERDALEVPYDASDSPTFGFEMDFKVFHKEALS